MRDQRVHFQRVTSELKAVTKSAPNQFVAILLPRHLEPSHDSLASAALGVPKIKSLTLGRCIAGRGVLAHASTKRAKCGLLGTSVICQVAGN